MIVCWYFLVDLCFVGGRLDSDHFKSQLSFCPLVFVEIYATDCDIHSMNFIGVCFLPTTQIWSCSLTILPSPDRTCIVV
ncbi:hypothetical protein L6452_44725 [Arctium lappa]|nr:hypothetical protein L6452_44725 [Arctium lappa]